MTSLAEIKSTRIITCLTSIVIGVVVIVIPLGYFLISYKYVAGSIETEAEIKARLITQVISQSPDMWQYENVRIEEYLTRRPSSQTAEIRRVLDNKQNIIAESKDELALPIITKSAKIYDSGTVVANIQISRSLFPLVQKTGLLFAAALFAGLLIIYVMGVVPIRTIRKIVSEALQKERNKAQLYLDIAGVIMVVLDSDYKITLINLKGCQLLGYDEQEVLGKNWLEKFVPQSYQVEIKHAFTLLGLGDIQLQKMESPVLTKSAGERIIEWNHVAIMDSDGSCKGFISSGNDITDSKKVELQLLHSQKIDSIGQYTSSIAHEFNNIITVIFSYCSVIRKRIQTDNETCKLFDHVVGAAERAASLTQRLLLFSRKEAVNILEYDLNEIVLNFNNFISKIIGTKITLSSHISQQPLAVLVDRGQIEQIMMNLSTNARDAMPNGGSLVIFTSSVIMDHGFIHTHGFGKVGAYAVISIKDTGIGMDIKTQKMLFEPFFTTKSKGKGTGLGMSIIQRIVDNHQGYISVTSLPGEGTTFRIFLPLSETQPFIDNDMLSIEKAGVSL
jgi:two-component system, cell cycle sensor histidine kinase and response regulator CckA